MSDTEKKIVLVADDEPSTRELVASHLRTRGYQVVEASDGDEAWTLAKEHLPNLVILDVMMPGMSGWEVCRRIREAVSLAHTGVIMLTGIGEHLNAMTSPLYGADAYVDKPFEFKELDEKVRETVSSRAQGTLGRPDAADVESAAGPSPESIEYLSSVVVDEARVPADLLSWEEPPYSHIDHTGTWAGEVEILAGGQPESRLEQQADEEPQPRRAAGRKRGNGAVTASAAPRGSASRRAGAGKKRRATKKGGKLTAKATGRTARKAAKRPAKKEAASRKAAARGTLSKKGSAKKGSVRRAKVGRKRSESRTAKKPAAKKAAAKKAARRGTAKKGKAAAPTAKRAARARAKPSKLQTKLGVTDQIGAYVPVGCGPEPKGSEP